MSAPDEGVYPVPALEGNDDSRFTFGLLIDVKGVIEAHGYPAIDRGRDLMELQLALFRFLHGTGERQAEI